MPTRAIQREERRVLCGIWSINLQQITGLSKTLKQVLLVPYRRVFEIGTPLCNDHPIAMIAIVDFANTKVECPWLCFGLNLARDQD